MSMPDVKGTTSSGLSRALIKVTGVVQGVGFRPFVYRLATDAGLSGHVINTPAGVEIDIEGPAQAIGAFVSELQSSPPPLARITGIETSVREPSGRDGFEIGETSFSARGHQLVSPDTCTCPDCLGELLDPGDRRYRYPFINCTNCGPRFTIIEELPYDRGSTTMNRFIMCPTCQAEYDDPANRRFHAEPNACPDCGPQLWLAEPSGKALPSGGDAVATAAAALREGKILALKGLGGFQLVCLATSEEAVERLRMRKSRPHKPFAVMIWSADETALRCEVSDDERQVLQSPERPIVLLRKLDGADIADSVAPGLNHLGVMLPYTPLHYLLMEEMGTPLVMTSGNLTEEPICRTNYEALSNLSGIADLFVLHDRRIRSTYDDSVVMVESGRMVMIRRARGYAPMPVPLPLDQEDGAAGAGDGSTAAGGAAASGEVRQLQSGGTDDVGEAGGEAGGADGALRVESDAAAAAAAGGKGEAFGRRRFASLRRGRGRTVFAAGPELKNTFCLARSGEAFLSQHMGDMENVDTLLHYERTGALFERLLDMEPDTFACDSHPDYLSTAYCLERHPVPFRIQHHQAHIAACLVDNLFTGEVLGIALDGTGFGSDGTIWGGEFFIGGLHTGFDRVAHLAQFPLLGGEAAIREPWRTALAAVWMFAPESLEQAAELLGVPKGKYGLLMRQLTGRLNCPQTSSCGRLFDAVAALAIGRLSVSYEAQAAIELETAASECQERHSWAAGGGRGDSNGRLDAEPRPYRFDVDINEEMCQIIPAAAIEGVVDDVANGTPASTVAMRFHLGLADAIVMTGLKLARRDGLDTVALSGGVFQNRLLLRLVGEGFEAAGLRVLTHGQVPPNDGGVALGQAAMTMFRIRG